MKKITGLILAIALMGGAVRGQEAQPKRPENFTPYHYKMTIEELKEKLSEKTMALADEARKQLEQVNAAGTWKPNWESLETYGIPEWFKDAKLGIFLDYGPWSVPGYAEPKSKGPSYSDWYEEYMYYGGNPFGIYHAAVWGKDFRRDDFLPLLTGKDLDSKALIHLFKECGVKYFVPFGRHHGGWAMWDSAFTKRNAMEMGPQRNIFREFADACRTEGLKFGLYYSLGEWEYPIIRENGSLGRCCWGFTADRWSKKPFGYGAESMNGRCSGKIPVRDYINQYLLPLFKEAVDQYSPDLVWFDGEWDQTPEFWRSLDMAAYYFNQAKARGQEVTINDRFGGKERHKHFFTFWPSEFGALPGYKEGQKQYYEQCRSISHSFGFNWQDTDANSLSSDELIRTLVHNTANNGNLLLVVNPTGSGRIPELQLKRLRELGQWMAVNGEAVYATRPQSPCRQGTTYFTRGKDGRTVYAICTAWPGEQLVLKGLNAADGAKITMLGVTEPLVWKQDEKGLTITLPNSLQNEKARPCRHAWAIRIPNGGKQ